MSLDLAVVASLAEAAAVGSAVGFGLVQLRNVRASRRREGAFHLVQSLRTPEMLEALRRLDELPAGLDGSDLQRRLGDDVGLMHVLMGNWESLGILVFHDEVGLDLVDDFYSGSILQSWWKLQTAVRDVRTRTGRETRWEWFQWLAERMRERETGGPVIPAYVEHAAPPRRDAGRSRRGPPAQ